jgi:hypothetical protein
LRLTDNQIDIVMAAAHPLAPPDREPFLEAVAGALQGLEVGDGLVSRVCAEQQRRWFTPPVEGNEGTRWGERADREADTSCHVKH